MSGARLYWRSCRPISPPARAGSGARLCFSPEPPVLGRDFTSVLDLSSQELAHVLDVSLGMKRDGAGSVLAGHTLALIFEKPSLRTRVSFEMAMRRLGGSSIYMGAHEVQLGEREPARDAARVLSRMVSVIAARTFDHATVTELAEYADIPVVNALSDEEHPCQAVADLLTLRERFGDLRGVRLAYVGDGNNVARSLAYACVMAGMNLTCASPEGYELSPEVLAQAGELDGGGTVTVVRDPHGAVGDAAAVYTDVWASMGFEHEMAERREAFQGYELNQQLLASAPVDAVVMHDLPAHRGEEISDEVIESDRSIVFDQAENRMHAQQAVLSLLLGGSPQSNSPSTL
jgi:ornithine carbamoyltransferase